MEFAAAVPTTLEEALEDLQARFLNLPKGEVPTVPRVFFLIQQAHWFYEDELVDHDETGNLPHLSFTDFSRMMLEASPMLSSYCALHEDFRQEFKSYSSRIPKYGCVMLNAACTHVLLIAPYGKKVSFSFPKGKVNQGEAGIDCAAREAFEETGYNPRPSLDEALAVHSGDEKSGDYLKLYIAVGVPDDGSVVFTPQVKHEIGQISWVSIDSILEGTSGSASAVDEEGNESRIKTFMVAQFMPKVISMVQKRRKAVPAEQGSSKKGGGKKTGGKGGGGPVGALAGTGFAPSPVPQPAYAYSTENPPLYAVERYEDGAAVDLSTLWGPPLASTGAAAGEHGASASVLQPQGKGWGAAATPASQPQAAAPASISSSGRAGGAAGTVAGSTGWGAPLLSASSSSDRKNTSPQGKGAGTQQENGRGGRSSTLSAPSTQGAGASDRSGSKGRRGSAPRDSPLALPKTPSLQQLQQGRAEGGGAFTFDKHAILQAMAL